MLHRSNHDPSTSLMSPSSLTYEQGIMSNSNDDICTMRTSSNTSISNDVTLLHHCHVTLHPHLNQPKIHSNNKTNVGNSLHGCSTKQLQHHFPGNDEYAMELCNSINNSSCEEGGISTGHEQFCGSSNLDTANPTELTSSRCNFSGEQHTSDTGINLPSHKVLNSSALSCSDMSDLHQRRLSPTSHMDIPSLPNNPSTLMEEVDHPSDVSNSVHHFHNSAISHHHLHSHMRQESNGQSSGSEGGSRNETMSNLLLRHCHTQTELSPIGNGGNKHQNVVLDQYSNSNSNSNFVVKNEIDPEMFQCITSSSLNNSLGVGQKISNDSACSNTRTPLLQLRSNSGSPSSLSSSIQHDNTSMVALQQRLVHHSNVNNSNTARLHQNIPQHVQHMTAGLSVTHHQLMNQHPALFHSHHLEQQRQQQMFAAAAGADPRHHHLHYGNTLVPGGSSITAAECLTTQKAVAFLAGPRERIHVMGNPVDQCPRCLQESNTSSAWRPHRHIGELKIRYICNSLKNDLESNHHIDIPLCPVCNQVLYLFEFNSMLGVSNARRLHKYVLKCASRHVLPLLDLFCQTKKGGERCNANFKLQWCYGTMVKRCEAQKNRDHDLWWVRYKNEWKQRRTIIRYKKDFLSHLTDAQRSLLLGLGLEGEPPPDPKSTLGPTFDSLVSSLNGGGISGPKIKKRAIERGADCLGGGNMYGVLDPYDLLMNSVSKRRYRASDSTTNRVDYVSENHAGNSLTDYVNHHAQQTNSQSLHHHLHQHPFHRLANLTKFPSSVEDSGGSHQTDIHHDDSVTDNSLRHVMGAVVLPSSSNLPEDNNSQLLIYLTQQQQKQQQQKQQDASNQLQSNSGNPLDQECSVSTSTVFGPSLNNSVNYVATSNNMSENLRPQRGSSPMGIGDSGSSESSNHHQIPSHMIVTGTPTPPLPTDANSRSVAITVVGEPISSGVLATL